MSDNNDVHNRKQCMVPTQHVHCILTYLGVRSLSLVYACLASADHDTFRRYIGSEKAITNLPLMNGNIASGGVATFLLCHSAYLSILFSLRKQDACHSRMGEGQAL
jgi:hypothetical protein